MGALNFRIVLCTYERGGEIFKVNGECCFDTATTSHQALALDHPLDHAECVMHGPFHLIQIEIVGASQNHRRSSASLGAAMTEASND
jgi:hypothetical protein